MQFNQPTGFQQFQPTGFTNYGQLSGFSSPVPYQYNSPIISGYPEIIGEGYVTAIVAPDGSTQLLFMPTTRWRPFPQCTSAANLNYPFTNNLSAWFVRSIYNPVQPSTINIPCQGPCGFLNPRATTSDCCLNLPAPAFPLKFHNDSCTSTSDLHYFTPKQYDWFKNLKESAAVQVGLPLVMDAVSHRHYSIQQCSCTQNVQNIRCMCFKIASQMSVEETSDLECQKYTNNKMKPSLIRQREYNQCLCAKRPNNNNSPMSLEESVCDHCLSDNDNQKNSNKNKPMKSSLKVRNKKDSKFCKVTMSNKPSSNVQCECNEIIMSDKFVTTYDDQATDCAPDGQETQTECSKNYSTPNIAKEICSQCESKIEIWNKESQSKSSISHEDCDCTSDSETDR